MAKNTEIPYEYISFTNEMVEYISSQTGSLPNNLLMVALSDHINFAIERKKQGPEFTNPLMDSINDCFPHELAMGRYCAGRIKEELGVELIEDEAGFIVMHIINAQSVCRIIFLRILQRLYRKMKCLL